MRLRVQIGEQVREVTPRTGERFISRAILGAVVEAGEGRRLTGHAYLAARALSAGLSGYQASGPPPFRVEVLD